MENLWTSIIEEPQIVSGPLKILSEQKEINIVLN